MWNPSPNGLISSEQFGIAGSNIDFAKDLNFTQTRFKDLRIVLRPSKKQKFHIRVHADRATSRPRRSTVSVVFNGINFNVQLPIQATFGWNAVWRFGH